MSLNFRSMFVLVAAALFLGGCATPIQQRIDLADNYFLSSKAKEGRVGVVMVELPKPDTAFPGANCLLCLGVANGMHSSLSKEVKTFSTAELKPLPHDLVVLLKKRGLDAVLIDEPLKIDALPDLNASEAVNKSRKNFTSLKAKYNIDRLVVIHFTALGVWRSYSAYVPTDPPKAVVVGSASLVDLTTHSLEWYQPVTISRTADGDWDEPPKFPGLTNAYYQVLESGMDVIKKPFVR
ncbi:hypothetical protein [Limnobacter parvus]|uniref:Uncharacterized protein n=1 Tax=Limnobacter parvus TaxID=2939690 RepID=A0ABT1XKU0_9BURK|nr:hypothetical protein [Limnobacter parvus]MCR2747913.1 hypothetical protein [Limnobacter parvus]